MIDSEHTCRVPSRSIPGHAALEAGCVAGARPACVSQRAKERQRREMGTLGSGNHYLEVQAVADEGGSSSWPSFSTALVDRKNHIFATSVATIYPRTMATTAPI
jgi:tRNA-splicing ligase RtcB